jgi:hypothetical protein
MLVGCDTMLTYCLIFTLKMEAPRSSENLISYHITARRQNPEDHDLNETSTVPNSYVNWKANLFGFISEVKLPTSSRKLHLSDVPSDSVQEGNDNSCLGAFRTGILPSFVDVNIQYTAPFNARCVTYIGVNFLYRCARKPSGFLEFKNNLAHCAALPY